MSRWKTRTRNTDRLMSIQRDQRKANPLHALNGRVNTGKLLGDFSKGGPSRVAEVVAPDDGMTTIIPPIKPG